MSQSKKILKPLSLALGATFAASLAASPVANAASVNDNPFAMSDLHSGYSQSAASAIEATCGSSNTSSTSTKGSKKKSKTTEATCGGSK